MIVFLVSILLTIYTQKLSLACIYEAMVRIRVWSRCVLYVCQNCTTLMVAPFEPLVSAPERILTLKVTLLFALTSLKRVVDLQALSVSEMCMDFAPGPYALGLAMFPRFYPHCFALRWSHFMLSILLHLPQARMKGCTCSVLSKL